MALGHHLYDVPVAQLINVVPPNTEQDEVPIKIATIEKIRGVVYRGDYSSDKQVMPLLFMTRPIFTGTE